MGLVTLTQQGLGDSQHKPEKRFLKQPEILINQNAQDTVYARIRPFKSIRDLRGHLIEPLYYAEEC